MTRASGGQSRGRGFAAASAGIPATSDAQQVRARVLPHQRARLESLKLPPPLWSLEWVRRARSLRRRRRRRSVLPPAPPPPLRLPGSSRGGRVTSRSWSRGTADARRAAPTPPEGDQWTGTGRGEAMGWEGAKEGTRVSWAEEESGSFTGGGVEKGA